MRYAVLNDARVITNIIEIEPANASDFDAHYLGDSDLSIGQQYPNIDLIPIMEPTETERIRADIDFLAAMMGVEL